MDQYKDQLLDPKEGETQKKNDEASQLPMTLAQRRSENTEVKKKEKTSLRIGEGDIKNTSVKIDPGNEGATNELSTSIDDEDINP